MACRVGGHPRCLVALVLRALASRARAGAQEPLQQQIADEVDGYDDGDPEVRALIAWRLRAWTSKLR